MKKILFGTLLGISLLFTPGCTTTPNTLPPNTTSVDNILPYVKAGTIVACAAAIQQVKPEDRLQVAHQINAVSVAVVALTAGQIPTPQQLHDVLLQFAPNQAGWAVYATAIQDIYAENFSKLNNDARLAVLILGKIAQGCQEASGVYIQEHANSPTTNIVTF